MRQLVFCYHGNCFDGFGAYYYGKKFLSNAWRLGDCSIRYQEINFKPDVELQFQDHSIYAKGSLVFFADYCPSASTLNSLKDRGCTVLVMDHHESARRHVEGFHTTEDVADTTGFMSLFERWKQDIAHGDGSVRCIFDMERSGAGITYDFFWGHRCFHYDVHDKRLIRFHMKGRPALVKYLEDRDLWRWHLNASREINAYIQTHEWTYSNYELLESRLSTIPGISRAAYAGTSLLKEVEKTVDMITKDKIKVVDVFDGICTKKVGFFNSTSHWSEVGNHVVRRFPEIDISCSLCFDFVKHQVMFSFRSLDGDKNDCTVLARQLSGGGHKCAAGTTMRIGDAMEFLTSRGVV